MFLKHTFWNVLGSFVRQLALGAQEFGVRLLIPPATLGVWELANLIRRVGSIWDLGVLGAAQRDLPTLRGLVEPAEERAYRSTTFVVQFASRALVAVAVLIYAAMTWQGHDPFERAAMVAGAVMLILGGIIDTLTLFYQSAELYAALSPLTMIASLIIAGAALAGTALWGVTGLLIMSVLGLVIHAALLTRSLDAQDLAIGWKPRADLVRRLLGFGLPLKAADYPLGLLGELDLLFVAQFGGLGPLAIYATAKTLVTQAVQGTSWLALVLIVRINSVGIHPAKRTKLGADIKRYLLVVDLVLLPALIVLAWVAGGALITHLIPDYAQSVQLLPIMLLTIYFVPQTTVIRNLWILDRRIGPVAVSNIVGLAAGAVCIGAGAAIWGFDLRAVAIGYFCGHLVYYGWIMATVGCQTFGRRGALEVAAHAAASCAYVASVIALTAPAESVSLGTAALRGLGAIVLLLPLVAYGVWQSSLIDYLGAVWRTMRAQRDVAFAAVRSERTESRVGTSIKP